jgi:hypothetical protein
MNCAETTQQPPCSREHAPLRTMRTVDIAAYTVIKEGVEICVPRAPGTLSSAPRPSAPIDALLPAMERNEGAVYWLQPKGGTVEQQEACICVNGVFYMLNSKFEKAIFRSVRLTRDFQNCERLVDGTRKLVIPRRLFNEKLRTSRRVRPRASGRARAVALAARWRLLRACLFDSSDSSDSSAPVASLSLLARPPYFQNTTLMHRAAKPAAPEAAKRKRPRAAAPPAAPAAPAAPPAGKPASGPEKKRRKAADADAAFSVVEAVLAQPAPPLLPTPQSLFGMLCGVFELEFPGCLPQRAVDEALLALAKDAKG